jgi:hypothetical protein
MSEVYHGKFGTATMGGVTMGGVTMEVTSWSVTGWRSAECPRRRSTYPRGSVSMTVVWNPPPSKWWDLIGGWYKGRPGFCLADALRPSRN